jgi:hypothetical protein
LRTFLVKIGRADATKQRVWGRVHKDVGSRNLNSYLLETMANSQLRNYAFSRTELVTRDELFPGNLT